MQSEILQSEDRRKHLMRETIRCNQRGNRRCNQKRNQRGPAEGASKGANTHHPSVPLTGHPHDVTHTELEAGRRSRMPKLTLRAVLLDPGRTVAARVADAAPVPMEGRH